MQEITFSDLVYFFFFFKQKTAYEMRISDWSSDVCSSDLLADRGHRSYRDPAALRDSRFHPERWRRPRTASHRAECRFRSSGVRGHRPCPRPPESRRSTSSPRSEEHTSELQSLMRISYAVFCLTKTKKQTQITVTEYYNRADT